MDEQVRLLVDELKAVRERKFLPVLRSLMDRCNLTRDEAVAVVSRECGHAIAITPHLQRQGASSTTTRDS